MIPHCGISNCGVLMEFLYSITTYKCGVYNIPEKLQMITTFFNNNGTNLVFPVNVAIVSRSFIFYTFGIQTLSHFMKSLCVIKNSQNKT